MERRSLAVSREGRENVITPYSSYLMMQFAPEQALANLERIESYGMFGRYGFYESLDFSRTRVGGGYAVIKSFMSHHTEEYACFLQICVPMAFSGEIYA